MPLYLYQLAYTPESLAAQMKDPQDRLESAAKPVIKKVGGKLIAGGYSFGEYDVSIVFEAPDDEAVASVAIAVAAGGAVRASKTTKLLSGKQWIAALEGAAKVAKVYKPKK
jgi:uncharacterized protein with GYD domain